MRRLNLFYLALIIIICSCSKDDKASLIHNINGKVQKGPFLIGTEITISELDKNLSPTGKNYFATIIDDLGSFKIPNIQLASDFVVIKAHGAYFNELDSAISSDLLLNCLASVKHGEIININILTHLTKDRILKLVSLGKSFEDARIQTNNEFLKIFNLENYNIEFMDKLDLTKSTESNDILFALNLIVVGKLSGINLTEFLTKFITDFEADGEIDSKDIQSQLLSNALYASPNQSYSNLKARYISLDLNIEESNSSKYIKEFITKSTYNGYFDLETPKITSNGLNLITLPDGDKLDTNINYTIALTKNSMTKGMIYLNLETLSSDANIVFLNSTWHSDKGEREIWSFDNIDNAIRLKGAGKIRLQYWISSDKYSTINVIKNFYW